MNLVVVGSGGLATRREREDDMFLRINSLIYPANIFRASIMRQDYKAGPRALPSPASDDTQLPETEKKLSHLKEE